VNDYDDIDGNAGWNDMVSEWGRRKLTMYFG